MPFGRLARGGSGTGSQRLAVFMGGGPSVAYASQALDAFDQFSSEKE